MTRICFRLADGTIIVVSPILGLEYSFIDFPLVWLLVKMLVIFKIVLNSKIIRTCRSQAHNLPQYQKLMPSQIVSRILNWFE